MADIWSQRRAARYGKYAGGDPLAPPVDLREALDATEPEPETEDDEEEVETPSEPAPEAA